MAAQSGRPGQLSAPAPHGYQLSAPAPWGANEGYAPPGPEFPATPPRAGQLSSQAHGYQLSAPTPHGANEGYPDPPIGTLFADDGISLVLEDRQGQRWASKTADRRFGSLSLDITLEANAVADWTATVPYAPGLERWTFATAHIGHDGERVFRGQFAGVDSDDSLGAGETGLKGLGPVGRMQRGEVSITFAVGETEFLDAAIEEFLARHAPPQLRFRVVAPTDHDRVPLPDADDGDREFEGSPLKVFAELVALAGMAWTVDHGRRDPLLEVFRPGIQRPATWRTLDISRSLDVSDYNNWVIVRGARKNDGSGERFRGEARDEWERRNIADPPPIEITQPDLVTDGDCQARAERELEAAIGQRQLAASAETTPALVSAPPGYYYRIEELEGEGITNDGAAYLPLTQTSYTESAGEAGTSLSFEDTDETEDLIRDIVRDGLSTTDLRRVERAYDQPDDSAAGYGVGYGENYGGGT